MSEFTNPFQPSLGPVFPLNCIHCFILVLMTYTLYLRCIYQSIAIPMAYAYINLTLICQF